MEASKSLRNPSWPKWLSLAAGCIIISLLLAWSGSHYQTLQDWPVFLGTSMLAGMLLIGGWWFLKLSEHEALPGQLGLILLLAVVLRLGASAAWFQLIPIYGHGTPEERAGYIMSDAYTRDRTAWELATSEKPLLRAFQGTYRKADQYGGLLFISAGIYRVVGGTQHQPLVMTAISAAFSSLAIIFTWAFSRRAWNPRVANLTAWGLALYPETILLGSSQMREAYTITLAAMAFYGLIKYLQEHTLFSLLWILIPWLAYLAFSPPFAALLLVGLGVTALFAFNNNSIRRSIPQRWLWIVILILLLLVMIGIWVSWRAFAPDGINNPVDLANWWLRKSASWQAYQSERASGWMQKVFDGTPELLHIPILVGYGILRPFLPASIIATSSSPLWPWITIWRAAGWTVLLGLLLYASIRAWNRKDHDRIAQALVVFTWLVILVASFRGGGDQDDNPRYRAAFACIQIALAAWAWVSYRQSKDVWFRRALITLGLILIWFIPWYLRRYTTFEWPVENLFLTISLGLASGLLYLAWDIRRSRLQSGVDSSSNEDEDHT
ncbi:MAG TPA: hypothetical protein VN363_06520 [Anaerolineales bacterium]|nr:hypothetical protein [Anaerolineales bacterium]